MIKKLRIQITYGLCLLFVGGFLFSPITRPMPMGCESSAGSVCTI